MKTSLGMNGIKSVKKITPVGKRQIELIESYAKQRREDYNEIKDIPRPKDSIRIQKADLIVAIMIFDLAIEAITGYIGETPISAIQKRLQWREVRENPNLQKDLLMLIEELKQIN